MNSQALSQVRVVAGIPILSVQDAGTEEMVWSQLVATSSRLIDQGAKALVVDLGGLKILRSGLISALIEVLERALEVNTKLVLVGVEPTVRRSLEIMGLAQYCGMYDSVYSAVATLAEADAIAESDQLAFLSDVLGSIEERLLAAEGIANRLVDRMERE